jgi:molecular chaperone DnaK
MSENANIIVGIDLGTTNSVVAIMDADKNVKTLTVEGNKLLPSVVSLTDDGFIVGQTAKNMALLEPEKTVASIKRKMGKDIVVAIGDKKMRPEEISALVLKKIKQTVVKQFGLAENAPLRAVVTVPAYFTEEQRDATKQAADLAGLQVERIINEPTAAALAFGLSQMDEAVYAIYDFGGGTFDVSIIESNNGMVEVLATTGDNNLGGDDLDMLLADFLWAKFLTNNKLGTQVPRSSKENARLIRLSENTKIKLSEEDSVAIEESFFANVKGINYHLETTVTRAEFEKLIYEKVEETVVHLENAIKDAKLDADDLSGIVLVGGSSRIPLVQQLIENQLFIAPTLIDLPDEAVAHGAAIQGAIIDNVDIDTILVDITPHSLGVAVRDDEMFSYQNMLRGIAPEDLLSAGMIIPKNTPIPTKRTRMFGSSSAHQEKYHLQVYQGEDPLYKKNRAIGDTYLEVENPPEHGEIEVTFSLDINGLLRVTAFETTTQKMIQVEFKSSRGKKIKENQLASLHIVEDTDDSSDHPLIKRAENLVADADINEEDQAELKQLITRFKNALHMGDESAEEIENELLELIYFIEQNK